MVVLKIFLITRLSKYLNTEFKTSLEFSNRTFVTRETTMVAFRKFRNSTSKKQNLLNFTLPTRNLCSAQIYSTCKNKLVLIKKIIVVSQNSKWTNGWTSSPISLTWKITPTRSRFLRVYLSILRRPSPKWLAVQTPAL